MRFDPSLRRRKMTMTTTMMMMCESFVVRLPPPRSNETHVALFERVFGETMALVCRYWELLVVRVCSCYSYYL